MTNILLTSVNMFLSVLIGAFAIAVLGLYAPDLLFIFFDWGNVVADKIYHTGLISSQIVNIVRFLINGEQMVFLTFIIIARVLLSLIVMPFRNREA